VNTAASQREKKEEKKEKALMFFDRVVQWREWTFLRSIMRLLTEKTDFVHWNWQKPNLIKNLRNYEKK
jgi:hypothetical protein